MKKIEFIGASGVGKSYLYNRLLEEKGTRRLWKTPDEARIGLARKVGFRNSTLIKKLSLICIKFNIFPRRHTVLASYILRDQLREKLRSEAPKYEELIALMLKSVVQGEADIEAYRKGQFIRFYMNLLFNDIIAIEELGDDEVIVYDDGIVHNTAGLAVDDYFDLMLKNDPDILKRILPNGVVYCTLSIEENTKRRERRISEGGGTCYENDVTSEELRHISRNDIEVSSKLIKLMERFDIPILKIDMNSPVEENIRLVNGFIDRLCKSDL